MAQQRVLVTGGAGYIGSMLVPKLLGEGYEVTVLDTFARGDTELAASCADPKFTPVQGNVRDEALMKKLLAKADIVIPLAALVGAPLCKREPHTATAVNREAVLWLVKNLSREQKILYPTTNSGYGIGEAGKECTEETPLRPISLYGVDKVEAERAILDSGNGVTFRLATVFGMAPRMRIDLLVNDFTLRAVRDRAVLIFEGHFKRNYIHVRDVARAFLHGIENYERMNNQPYNVGLSDANLSKLELCERIKRHVPNFVYVEAPIGEDPDKRDYIVSNSKIEGTGWVPAHSLDAGIAELIKGYTMLNPQRFANV
ncbi:MAG: SDR family oxidoreductase [Parvibaculum sp.]|uniref:NAD-dependent epimerase/dehydratase family protein n=1 Tax=Parvibaculum sp. TaxID=2024848 RepID=UPI002846EA5F|nr:SDR family oxidoreductase [Parvibaculum sp.]MDR3499385.1 SDR family oxidoreductase [Parvibaculum sp.]